ncbi:MAG: hypothetical protein QXY77_00765 [Thermoplasmatales archaeon]
MDLIPGIAALIISILLVLLLRGAILRKLRNSYRQLYKDLPISSVNGLNPGLMTYLISIITAIIGPFSFRLYNLTLLDYIFLNVLAGVFFSLTYPYFSPITSFSKLDIIEKNGKTFCVAGKILNRRLTVISIKKDLSMEIDVKCGRGICTIETPNPDLIQKSS